MVIREFEEDEDDVDFMDIISEAYGDDEVDPITEYYEDRDRGEEIRDLVAEDVARIESEEEDSWGENDNYLERLGLSEEIEEDDELVIPFHRTGHVITNLTANNLHANNHIVIADNVGNESVISATEINHPEITTLKEVIVAMVHKIEELSEEINNLKRSRE